jgi:hypothetical protein
LEKYYFWNLMEPTLTNLNMEIPMVYSEFKNSSFFRMLTFRGEFLELMFLTFWFCFHCRA